MFDIKIGRQSGKPTIDYFHLKVYAQLEKNFEKMLFMAGLEVDYMEGLDNSIERINKIKKFTEENDIKINVEKSPSGADIYTMSKKGVDILMFAVKIEYNFDIFESKMFISDVKRI